MGGETMIDFNIREIDDNAFHTDFFIGQDLSKLTTKQWFQFAKANKVFKEPGISSHELMTLHTACEKVLGNKSINIVETGMCYGVTTRYFLVRILKYGGTLTCFEMKIRELFESSMMQLGLWDRIIKRGHSMKDSYSGDIDLLWIDSEHALEDALGEYMRFRVWCNENTLIGFHDTDCCPGVVKAIELIQEVDELEPIADSTNVHGAGCQLFKIKKRNRSDRAWNTRARS